MFGARLWQFYIQMNPDSWKRLGNDEWEFKCRWSFLVCDTNGKVIRSKKYDINSVAGSRNEVSLLRDGSKLTSVFDVYNTELGTCLSRVFPDGRVVWEAFLPYSNINRAVEVFPLVRFGFSAKGQIDTLEDRLRMLQSGNVLLRRHGVIKLKAFPMDDTVFAALVKSLRDPDEFVRHQALPLVRRSPERCKEAISDFARLLNEPYAPSLAPVYDAMGPEKSIPVLLKAFKDSSSPNADRRRCNAIWLLGRLYIGHDDQVTEVLRASINSQDKVLKIQAMASVAGHPKAKVLLKEVINAIDDPDKDVARGAIGSLSHLGSNANPAIPALLKAMERPEVRGHVVGTFKFVGIDDPQVLKKLIDCLGEEESPEIVADAAGALARRGKQAKDAVKPLIKLLNNKWSGIIGFQAQANAACALGAIGPDAKEALEPLVRIVSTGSRIPVNYDVLIHAIGGIDPATRIELIKRETRFPKNKVPEIDPQIKQLPRIKL
jgi:HEAT repeat protein